MPNSVLLRQNPVLCGMLALNTPAPEDDEAWTQKSHPPVLGNRPKVGRG